MKKIYKKYVVALLSALCLAACSGEFLEVKPQRQQVIVETLQDVEALLDNSNILNRTDYYRMISDGDFYYTDSKVTSISEVQRNLYLWAVDIDPAGLHLTPWDLPYQQIMYANIALETLREMTDDGDEENVRNELYGRALFFRAWAHYQLLQDFAEGYDPAVDAQPGVPIIMDSSCPNNIPRGSLRNAYRAITDDLTEARAYLPQQTSIKTRPSMQAVYALLARIYLNLHDFENALLSAEKALEINRSLLDFNAVSRNAVLPFSSFNFSKQPEIIFFTSSNIPLVPTPGIQIEEGLYSYYHNEHRRKYLFFNNDRLYNGTYSGASAYHFTGLATDELYLVKAECLVRLGRPEEGVGAAEELLQHRFLDNAIAGNTADRDNPLRWVLEERRKELVGRGTRWSDLKRLNRDVQTRSDLIRTYQGERYKLPANSSRYVFAIPADEVELSGLAQNIRE